MNCASYLALLVLISLTLYAVPVQGQRKFSGTTLGFIMWAPLGYQLEKHIQKWENRTGGKVIRTNLDVWSMPAEIDNDFHTINRFDLINTVTSWIPGWVKQGFISDITDRLSGDFQSSWLDISLFVRQRSSGLQKRVYMIPVDGDVMIAVWRDDLLKANNIPEPQTWDDALAIAKFFHGKDINGDGKPDYGWCIDTSSIPFYYFFGILPAFIQSTGSSQGFWFDNVKMTPFVKTEAWTEAWRIYKEIYNLTKATFEKEDLNIATVKIDFIIGRCPIMFDFTNIGSWSLRPESRVLGNPFKFKTGLIFGSRKVLDWETGKLVPCDQARCPYAESGINRAPYAVAGGGLRVMLNNNSKNAEVAWDLMSYLSSSEVSAFEIASSEGSFIDPYRISHFNNIDAYTAKGMPYEQAVNLLQTIRTSWDHKNVGDDMKLVGYTEYVGLSVPPSAFEAARYAILAGGNVTEAMDTLYKQWEGITEKIGRNSQLFDYRDVLQLPQLVLLPNRTMQKEDLTPTRIGLYVGTGIVAFNIIVLFVLFTLNQTNKIFKAASIMFCRLIFVGAFIAVIGIFLWIPEPTKTLCIARLIFLHCGFIMIFSNLSLKTWRIYQIFHNAANLGEMNLSNSLMFRILGVVMIPEIVILVVFGVMSNPNPQEQFISSYSNTSMVYCNYEHEVAWEVVFIVPPGLFLIIGVFLAFVTRNFKTEFNDAKVIAFIVYALSLEYAVLIPIIFVTKDTPIPSLVIPVMTGLIALLVVMNALFLIKYFQIKMGHDTKPSKATGGASKTSSTVGSSMGSNTI